ELDKEKVTALGIVLRDKKLSFALHNLKGSTVWKSEITLKEVVSSEWVPAILQNVSKAESECAKRGSIFLGSGFSIGSLYDPVRNVLVSVTDSSEKNISLNDLICNKISLGSFTTDDFPNAMAIGEMWFGSALNMGNFLYVQLFPAKITFVAGGKIYRGFRGFAGEVGSSNAVQKMVDFTNSKEGIIVEKIFKEWISDLALSFDPQKIVISPENGGGAGVDVLENINKYLRKQYASRSVSVGTDDVVAGGKIGKNERTLSAAALAFQSYFYPDFISKNNLRSK
ncbi:MAG: ROK family protein, partial [Fibrobacteres bacterium]|nr:ROK family protein [Fibrobacterota bacterium]